MDIEAGRRAAIFDEATNTITYVVKDPASNACAIVDSVMDIDYAAGRITYDHADALIAHIQRTRPAAGVDHRDPCPRRSPQCCALYSRTPWRQDRCWREDHGGAGGLRQESSTKAPSSNATASQFDKRCSKMATPIRSASMDLLCDVYAGPHACLHDACDGQRGVCRATRFSCRMVVRRGPISQAAMPAQLYDSIQKVLSAAGRDAPVSCAMITAPNGRAIAWETSVAEAEGPTTSMSAAARPARSSSSFRTERDAHAGHAQTDHPLAPGEHARGRVADRQGWQRPMLKVPVNGLCTAEENHQKASFTDHIEEVQTVSSQIAPDDRVPGSPLSAVIAPVPVCNRPRAGRLGAEPAFVRRRSRRRPKSTEQSTRDMSTGAVERILFRTRTLPPSAIALVRGPAAPVLASLPLGHAFKSDALVVPRIQEAPHDGDSGRHPRRPGTRTPNERSPGRIASGSSKIADRHGGQATSSTWLELQLGAGAGGISVASQPTSLASACRLRSP